MNMLAFWLLLAQILRFNQPPEAAPSKPSWLVMVILLDWFISVGGQALLHGHDWQKAVVIPSVDLAVELSALWLLTRFKSVGYRFIQTSTVIFGCDTLLTIVSLPVALTANALSPHSPAMPILVMLQMILLAWGLGMRSFVYHRTLNIGLIQANMLAMSLFLLSMTLTTKIFPDMLTQAQAEAAATLNK